MDIENQTLAHIAKVVGITPENLRAYLYEELPIIKRAVLIDSRITLLEQEMVRDGAGVNFCLIEKSDKLAPRPRTNSDFVGQILGGAYQEAAKAGYFLRYYVLHEHLATPDYFRHLYTKYPNAGLILLIPQRAETIATVSAEMKRHCVLLDYVLHDAMPVHTLNVDNSSAIREVTRKLIELGHRDIAFIGGIAQFASATERLEGYKAALAEANIPFQTKYVAQSNWSIGSGHDAAQQLLELDKPPTAIVCSNDQVALGTYGAVKEKGLEIPYDISVTGFDDIPIVANITPPLTTVRQSLSDLGQRSVDVLINVMEGRLTNEFTHMHPLQLIMRESISRSPR